MAEEKQDKKTKEEACCRGHQKAKRNRLFQSRLEGTLGKSLAILFIICRRILGRKKEKGEIRKAGDKHLSRFAAKIFEKVRQEERKRTLKVRIQEAG